MHELSLSYAAVDTILESAPQDALRVKSIRLLAGEFCGVSIDAFRFSFPIAAAGTIVEGAELEIECEAVTVYCAACEQVGKLESVQRFCCPQCGEPVSEIRSGEHFRIESFEIETAEELDHEHAHC